jgi:hypothetical protein
MNRLPWRTGEKMIIFDYSGTLSLEAPLFAAPDSLMKHLEATGLRDFGIDSPRIFWEQLVNPTWVAGSTTNAGYKKVLLDRIIAVLHPDMSIHRRATLAGAVSAFVDRYLSHSRIDARWEPVLHSINAAPSLRTVIATDHYAEATSAIIRFLGKWQIGAATATEAVLNPQAASFIVANSADLGVHKDDRRFWQILKENLRLDAERRILIIDDFGYNEQSADVYSNQHKVDARMKETVLTLEAVFPAAVEVFPFMVGVDAKERNARLETLIVTVTAVIDRFLTSR